MSTNTGRYIAVTFNEGDRKTFTYHEMAAEDAAPLMPGDVGQIVDHRTGRLKRVHVVSIIKDKPPFPTKPIERYVAPPTDDDKVDF